MKSTVRFWGILRPAKDPQKCDRVLRDGFARLFSPVRLPRQLFPGRYRELIRPVIPFLVRVSANPMPLDVVNLTERDQPSPEVLVQNSLPARAFPPVPLPLRKQPFGKGISDVLRIGEDVDGAGLLE